MTCALMPLKTSGSPIFSGGAEQALKVELS